MLGRLVNPWPGTHGVGTLEVPKGALEMIGVAPGTIIEVSGPCKPSRSWTCGTEVVWKVVDNRVPSDRVYCCEHQIKFDIEEESIESVPQLVEARTRP